METQLPHGNGHSSPHFHNLRRRLCLRPYNPRSVSIVAKRLDGSIPFGTEVGLCPDHIVLDKDPALPKGAKQPAHSSAHVYCGQTTGWIKMSLGYGGSSRPRPDCVRWGPSSPTERGTAASPKRSPISATAELFQSNPIQCVLTSAGSPLCPHRTYITITYKLVHFQFQLSRR